MKYFDLMAFWLSHNLDLVFFVYGLAFVYLGMAIFLQPRKGSQYRIAGILWLLAIFGVVHGANEWLDMWAIIKGKTLAFDIVRLSCLAVSFVALFEFGRRLNIINRLWFAQQNNEECFLPPYLSPWVTLGIAVTVLVGASFNFWPGCNILLRYGFGVTGSIMTGYGLIRYNRINKSNFAELNLNSYVLYAHITFIAYGILSGLIVPKASFFPASIINQDNFLAIVHIPVQIFRALSAVMMAWCFSHILKMFNLETQLKINEAMKTVQEKELALAKTEDRYRSIFDSINDPTFVHSFNGQIIEVNDVVSSVLGYGEQEILQKMMPDLLSNEGRTKFPECLKILRKKGFGIFESSMLTSAGRSVPMEMNCRVVEYNGVPAILSTARNIEERKKAEGALFIANEMLEMKVNERTDSLKKLNIELENSINDISN